MTWSEKTMNAILDYLMALPITLTTNSRHRFVRLLGLVIWLPWVIPALFVSLPLMMIALCLIPIEDAWKGRPV